MVLLTMTTSIVEAMKHTNFIALTEEKPAVEGDPSLGEPAIGKPISHSQIVNLWKDLRKQDGTKYSLESLLRGSTVYIPPPLPKPEPVSCFLIDAPSPS